ncbi:MAG: anthranilate synthase component I family protein [Acidobacteriota bacterium]
MARATRVVLALPPAMGGDRRARLVQPATILWQQDGRTHVERPGGHRRADDLLTALGEELERAGRGARAVGFMGYEFAATMDPLIAVPPGSSPLPEAWWAVLTPAAMGSAATAAGGSWRADPGSSHLSLDDEAFRRGVETIRLGIGAGDVYQVNLTRRFSLPFQGDPLALFTALGQHQWPRFATYLADREQGWAVLCLSPELLLARRGSEVETRPIKGTLPLPVDQRRRAQARARLRSSGKDAAELAMIVDLERNDLNRVCTPRSVRVLTPRRTFTTLGVMHQYAVVAGQLCPGASWQSLLGALLPGGSVTGAPKLAACRFIARLEPVPRAVYCGAIGVMKPDRGVLALPIRTGYAANGMLHFHAGCGVVWDSQPAAEEAESRAKVARWLEVLGGEPP